MRDARRPGTAYWVVVAVLVGFGVVAIFSIGLPFLLVGLTMAVVGPWRNRRSVVWPAVAGIIGFVVGMLIAFPWACGKTVGPTGPVPGQEHILSVGSCSTALGLFRYDTFAPSTWPALIASLALGVAAGLVAHRLAGRRTAARTEHGATSSTA